MIEIAAPRLKRLLSDWETRRRGREFPTRADFSPLDLKYIMGNLSLIEVTYNPLHFRYRIHGTNLAQRMRMELTNKSIDDIPAPKHAKQVRAQLTEVVERRVPLAFRDEDEYPADYVPRDVEILALPLAAEGKTITMIMYAVVWDSG
jgi:hypothetical protein